jgi:hypothetical protein
LQDQFSYYFNDFGISKFEWARNPFSANKIFELTTCEQQQLLYTSLKDIFDEDKIAQFWLLVKNDYPTLSDTTVKVLFSFVTANLSET